MPCSAPERCSDVQTKKLTRLISAARAYANADRERDELWERRPKGYMGNWPQLAKVNHALALKKWDDTVRELRAAAKSFAPKPKRKEKPVLKAS